MKRIKEENLNSKIYWNGIYGGEENRLKYVETTQGFHGKSQRLDFALKEVKAGEKVLDIGCGIGLWTELVKQTYPTCEVWGTDISNQAIEENKGDVKYLHQYIGEQDLLPNDYFDLVFSGEVIEHLEDPSLLFKDAHRVLKKGGRLVVTTPNQNRITSPEHIWEYTENDLENLYKDNGFESPRFVSLPDMEWFHVLFAVGGKK